MSSETNSSVIRAGRILLVLAALHLALSGLGAARRLPDWATGGLWLAEGGLADPTPSMGAFWISWGSFAIPLGLVGALVIWLGRQGHAPPSFLGHTITVWALVAAALFEPSPFILGAIPGLMLARAASPRGVNITKQAPKAP